MNMQGAVIGAVILIIIILVTGCASGPQETVPVITEPVPVVVQGSGDSLFDEAHRCQGIVRYQAEMQQGEMRSRLSCEWTAEDGDWGTW